MRAAGGVANAAPQVSFCAGTTCTITKIYDQTANHNDLPISPGGTFAGPGPNGADVGANAMALPVTVGGQTVYGVLVTPGTGYRIAAAKNVPTGSQPEGIYMVTSSNAVNGVCCFDYGSGEVDGHDDGNATMNAIYWGQACWTGGCTGNGPWVGGRSGERHVPQRRRPEQPQLHRYAPAVRQRLGEEQRHHQLHPQGRRRHHRRPDHHVLRGAAQRLLRR